MRRNLCLIPLWFGFWTICFLEDGRNDYTKAQKLVGKENKLQLNLKIKLDQTFHR